MPKAIIRTRSSIGNINYHIIFVCKWRRKFLLDRIDLRIKELLNEKAKLLNIRIVEMESDINHMHLFVKSSSSTPISEIVRQLKGYSSFYIRKEFTYLSKHTHFWSAGYFVETVGDISSDTILKYIKNQGK